MLFGLLFVFYCYIHHSQIRYGVTCVNMQLHVKIVGCTGGAFSAFHVVLYVCSLITVTTLPVPESMQSRSLLSDHITYIKRFLSQPMNGECSVTVTTCLYLLSS